ncbi:electron transport complex subunit RsxC [Candidatus Methylospira mobilis]|uniref:Ion-translocating oxidoreductase complex subunit C n=1 Tax=Candidatus Methylospira mobilis TaxID=1808979 RepID=A0A5Q0BL09_9GAMM|nr:electron transport complex subunit RsxC [Candidatus Methylospira mobilis]QFY42808.1 electron transport complex subunit RsxC [Candidatus Methylospira mobilis]WNV03700.1 electron transport complex subunit RsxC [Candidatus Methylospira mobilis]
MTTSYFTGGLHLDTHKTESSGVAPLVASIPETLIFPLFMRNGQDAQAVVEAGQHVLKGQILARDPENLTPPVHASSSGIIAAIETRALPHPSGLSGRCIVLNTDGLDQAREASSIGENYSDYPLETLLRHIHEAGIVGMGGAGFPTDIKLRGGGACAIDTLILNGAECEPYITCDDMLMRYHPEEVLGGARILMHILGLSGNCLLGIENDMPEAIASLEHTLQSETYSGIAIAPLAAIYPTGGEKQLIKALTGREVPSGGIPANVGVVCQNVATAAAIYRAIVHGEVLTSRIVTVTGVGVSQPANLVVRIGTPISDLVKQCGGYTQRAERLILGGPMMGWALPSDELPITRSANCVLVQDMATIPHHNASALPCIRCGECAQACPVSLLPQQMHWYCRSENLPRIEEYRVMDCIECGCCNYVCPSHIPLVQYFRAAKSLLFTQAKERSKAEHARIRFEARQARQQHEKRLREESTRRKREMLEKANKSQPEASS